MPDGEIVRHVQDAHGHLSDIDAHLALAVRMLEPLADAEQEAGAPPSPEAIKAALGEYERARGYQAIAKAAGALRGF